MICHTCHSGTIGPGATTVTLERDGSVIVTRKVPASVCDVCGEYTLSEHIASELYRKAETALERGAEVEIMSWVA